MRRQLVVPIAVVCLSSLTWSCSCGYGQEAEAQPVARRVSAVAVPTKTIGESCFHEGRSACLGTDGQGKEAVCWHFKPGLDDPTGYVCSRPCAVDGDCPMDFACVGLGGLSRSGVGVRAAQSGRFCAPRRDWVPHPALERLRPPRPAPAFAPPGPRQDARDGGGS